MRFTSLAVELIRARPVLVFWLAALLPALIWLVLPLALYASPPGEVGQVLAIGHEYRLGSDLGPPLAFWLADLAYRLAGMAGVYLLAQVCFVVMLWAMFALGRLMVGAQQAVLATLLTVTITAFSFPGVEFGPAILARPLWALVLLHFWQAVGEGRRAAWFALSFEIGLLLLTTASAAWLVGLMLAFALATSRGRRALASLDPLFALFVVATLLTPHLVWLAREAGGLLPPLPGAADLADNLRRWPRLAGGLMLTMAGIVLLALFNSGRLALKGEAATDEAPIILRPPLDPFARRYVFYFTLAPPLAASLIAAALGQERVIAGAGMLLAPIGLAVVIAAGAVIHLHRQRMLRAIWIGIIAVPALFVVAVSLLQPWTSDTEVKTMLPAAQIGGFFGDSFERRTGQPLTAVAGDPALAVLVALAAPSRPHLVLDAAPERSPWLTPEDFTRTGGIVVWRAADTAGAVPDDIRRRFPMLTPEVPRAFERMVQGRQPLLRIGWAIVRPAAAAAFDATGSTR
ncbi:MAG: glycosyltransferase family 39 protein [Xanthobacteraceae bacterium]|nr:MAG: glycosyltransferase family 39 protein [Xanthobacteraceae bacterium]